MAELEVALLPFTANSLLIGTHDLTTLRPEERAQTPQNDGTRGNFETRGDTTLVPSTRSSARAPSTPVRIGAAAALIVCVAVAISWSTDDGESQVPRTEPARTESAARTSAQTPELSATSLKQQDPGDLGEVLPPTATTQRTTAASAAPASASISVFGPKTIPSAPTLAAAKTTAPIPITTTPSVTAPTSPPNPTVAPSPTVATASSTAKLPTTEVWK